MATRGLALRTLLALCALVLPCAAYAAAPSALPTPRIAIDVGHGALQPGATSARGRSEYLFNRDLAGDILQALQDLGLDGAFVLDAGRRKRSPAERARLAARHGAALLLSVHHDSVQPHYLEPWTFEGRLLRFCDRFQGYSLFYSEKNPRAADSLRLARHIGAAMRRAGYAPTAHHAEPIPGENRDFVDPENGVYRFDDLLVLKTATLPAVLFEAGVIVHREEELRLQDPAQRSRMARAVSLGLAEYLEHPVPPPLAAP